MKKSDLQSTSTRFSEDITEMTRLLFDRLAVFAISFGALTVLGSILRISRYGFNFNIWLDIASYLAIVAILLMRNILPDMAVAIMTMGVLFINGCLNHFFTGLLTANTTLLMCCCVIVGVIFSYRAGVLMVTASIVIMGVAGALFNAGVLNGLYDPATYCSLPVAWISHLADFLVYSLACLTIINFIQKQLWSSLGKLRNRSEELLASEKKYRLLTENMRDVLLLLDANLVITYISPSVTTLFGYSVVELKTSRIDELLAPGQSEPFVIRLRQQMTRATDGGIDAVMPPMELECRRRDGSIFFAELSASIIRSSEGDLAGIQGILRDISERKKSEREKSQLEQKLRQSEKMQVIGQLAGGIAHDFNNQLAGIMGFAELIKADNQKDSDTFTAAQSITSIANRAADLTGKLLAFARKGNYHSDVIDIHSIIAEVAVILSRSIDRSISIEQRLDAVPSCVKGDPGQIQNALLNIALNARDAMQHGGTLSFLTSVRNIDSSFKSDYQHTFTPGKYIHIAISDTGTGIDDETKSHLFEPFFTTKEPGKGTGMGLAAVYGTIQAHNGILNVTSVVSEGTTFHIYLPVVDETVSQTGTPAPQDIVPGSGSILLIDDELNVGRMFSMLLRRIGYTIEICPNGEDAIKLFEENPGGFDAIILDLILPGMSGKDVFRKLRGIRRDIPILLCSGYSADNDVRKLLRDDMTLFIQKPFTMSELSHQTSLLLSKKQRENGPAGRR